MPPLGGGFKRREHTARTWRVPVTTSDRGVYFGFRTMEAHFRPSRFAYRLALMASLAVAFGASSDARDHRRPGEVDVDRELRFAAEMAGKGLWREAALRWERVLRVREGDARVLNNLAVAKEAMGDLDAASALYERARAADEGSLEIATNADLFESARLLRERRSSPHAGSASEATPATTGPDVDPSGGVR